MKLFLAGLMAFLFLLTASDGLSPPALSTIPPTATTPASPEGDSGSPSSGLVLQIGETAFSVKLYPHPAAQALAERLPMTLSMGELNGNEKFYFLNNALPTDAEPPGDIRVGDLMLYGNNCLVLFYKSFSSPYRYTRLGHVENPAGLVGAVGGGDVNITFLQP